MLGFRAMLVPVGFLFGCAPPGAAGVARGTETSTSAAPSDGSASDAMTPVGGLPDCDADDRAEDEGEAGGGFEEGSGGGSGGLGDTSIGMGGQVPLGATAFQIRQQELEVGTYVEVQDLVVTTPPVYAEGSRLLFAQSRDADALAGLDLRITGTWPLLETLLPGDVITVRGVIESHGGLQTLRVRGSDEELERTSRESSPAPILLDEATVTKERLAELAGMLVRIERAQVSAPSTCRGEIPLEASLQLDDLYVAAQGEALPAATDGIYESITGPIVPTDDGLELAPRSLEDIGL